MAHSICLIKLYQITMRKNFDFLFLTSLRKSEKVQIASAIKQVSSCLQPENHMHQLPIACPFGIGTLASPKKCVKLILKCILVLLKLEKENYSEEQHPYSLSQIGDSITPRQWSLKDNNIGEMNE